MCFLFVNYIYIFYKYFTNKTFCAYKTRLILKYDHGVIYTVNRPPPGRTRHKTRQKNTPIVPVANQPPVQHHLQQSVHQRPNPPVKLESKPLVRLESKSPVRLESKPLVRLEPKPIFKCIGCGKELQPLYGQEPGLMCLKLYEQIDF